MAHNSTEAAAPNSTETSLIGGEFTVEEYIHMSVHLLVKVSQYVTRNPKSTNTQLFKVLAVLNNYVPESYLSMSECQRILGPPDPIHGGPPFEQRMKPFTQFIRESTDDGHIYIHPVFEELALEVMVNSGMTRSAAVKDLMLSLCGEEPQPDTIEFIKDLLTKREMGEKGKEKFSRLIQDISDQENPYHVISVLKTASNMMRQNPTFPQTLSRFYYIRRKITCHSYERAKKWAQEAIKRAPNNSFVADTLGQVYKNRLLRMAKSPDDILKMAEEARKAFKEVERKAEREVGPEVTDEAGALYSTSIFNNRGHFGLIQVAKIGHEKLQWVNDRQSFIQGLRTEVEAKFDFFEWYLTYSKPSKTSLEPSYFWKDVAECFRCYTGASAADSTSFPGLLERLNRGLFTSRGRYSGFVEVQETLPELEMICNGLKADYEANVDDDVAAERYILSNVILSNRAPDSPSLAPLTELKGILSRFLDKEARNRSPEFYLLVLLLFWPQEHPQEQEVEPEPDLQQCVTDMRRAFEGCYSKYLRGRYLVPLFFLGKGSGLSRWIHKSKLDAFVETEVDARLARENNGTFSPERTRQKWELINKLWRTGEVWKIPTIQEILLPVRTDPTHPPTIHQEEQENRVFVCAGGRTILATTESECNDEEPTESECNDEEPTESECNDEEPTESECNDEEPTESECNDEEPTESECNDEESTESECNDEEPTESESDDQEPTESESDDEEPTLYLGLTIQGPVVFKSHVQTRSESDE